MCRKHSGVGGNLIGGGGSLLDLEGAEIVPYVLPNDLVRRHPKRRSYKLTSITNAGQVVEPSSYSGKSWQFRMVASLFTSSCLTYTVFFLASRKFERKSGSFSRVCGRVHLPVT